MSGWQRKLRKTGFSDRHKAIFTIDLVRLLHRVRMNFLLSIRTRGAEKAGRNAEIHPETSTTFCFSILRSISCASTDVPVALYKIQVVYTSPYSCYCAH